MKLSRVGALGLIFLGEARLPTALAGSIGFYQVAGFQHVA